MNYSKLLEESNSANIQYPDLIKPVKVWRIKEISGYRGCYSSSYLSFSFVMEKNLKFPELGFNLVLNQSLNQRPICFLNEEDAKQFYDIYKNKAIDLRIDQLEVGGGRGGNELVKISKDGGIPVYGNKSSVEYLLKYADNKVPEYVKNRLKGEVSIPDEQKAKDLKKQTRESQWVNFVKNYFAAVREVPGFKNIEDPAKIEDNPVLKSTAFTPYIRVFLDTAIDTIPVIFELQVSFKKEKSIDLLALRVSSHYIFDKTIIDAVNDIAGYDTVGFPIRVSTIKNENNTNIIPAVIYYKRTATLKNTATKDEIKNYITSYLTDIREYLENIEAEEEM